MDITRVKVPRMRWARRPCLTPPSHQPDRRLAATLHVQHHIHDVLQHAGS